MPTLHTRALRVTKQVYTSFMECGDGNARVPRDRHVAKRARAIVPMTAKLRGAPCSHDAAAGLRRPSGYALIATCLFTDFTHVRGAMLFAPHVMQWLWCGGNAGAIT